MKLHKGSCAKRIGLAAGLAFAPLATSGAIAANLNLVCSGNSYAKEGDPFPTVETVTFKKEDGKPLAIGLPGSDKPAKAKIVSNNAYQLKFSADRLTGEYFNFSGDLFLIHKDGRFTRLVCKPAQ
ncbi:hypothetical protein [Methylocapsa palsarum]|uniref:Membrane-bound lysozyme-inhibitor of c-type lysozyme n=1 Tax=Methylocapsa palsarum TaxID=1612308 RepID=A0A1I4B1M8_9HYPH|nr:hypothetical protein [Methylocapsa palsarum]SFK62685.1 hypothetical protein SAMN05444581_112107 [Methylocapsa palsarum]